MEIDQLKEYFETVSENLKKKQEELVKKEKQMKELFEPRLMKEIKGGKATLTKTGSVIIELANIEEVEKFYKSLE